MSHLIGAILTVCSSRFVRCHFIGELSVTKRHPSRRRGSCHGAQWSAIDCVSERIADKRTKSFFTNCDQFFVMFF